MDLSKLLEQREQQTNGMSAEEYAQWKQQEREQVWESIDQTTEKICGDEKSLQRFFDFQSRHKPCRISNQILLYSQNDKLTDVRTFDDWKKAGRSVKKGERGYSFLTRREYRRKDGSIGGSSNVVKAYDVLQTSGRQMESIPSQSLERLLAALIQNSPADIAIDSTIPEKTTAIYHPDTNCIHIRNVPSAKEAIFALARETAHSEYAKMPDYARERFAVQAYCATYLFAKRNGMDVSNFQFGSVSENLRNMDNIQKRLFLSDVKNGAGAINQLVKQFEKEHMRNEKQKSSGQERG